VQWSGLERLWKKACFDILFIHAENPFLHHAFLAALTSKRRNET